MHRGAQILSRQLKLVIALASAPRGLSSVRLAEQLECSLATVNRDLRLLRERVGLRIEPTRVSGEVWHRLDGMPLRLSVTAPQLVALALARQALEPLEGTELLRELDGLLPFATDRSFVQLRGAAKPKRSAILRDIERAITSGCRLAIDVRVASRGGARMTYVVEPITVRMIGADGYLDAWSIERDDLRTYKLARIQSTKVLHDQPAAPHSDVDVADVFQSSVKTWSGDIVRVRIRLAPDVAWMADEYPLIATQTVVHETDGSAIVEADVAGLVEASRWVLGWGRQAEVLAPDALRELVRSELEGALARYAAPERDRSSMVSDPEPSTPRAPSSRRARSSTRTTQVRGEEET